MLSRNEFLIGITFLGCFCMTGCGQPKGGEMGESPAELREVNDLLRVAGAARNRAPSGVAELERHKDNFVIGFQGIKSGKVVVVWGTPFAGEGDAGKNESLLAYQKSVPSEGGYVLLSAGTIKKVTSAEFGGLKK